MKLERDFKSQVYTLVKQIPEGRVMTYGRLAALCGHPRAARTVGQIAHWGPEELPWQRVVNHRGGLARSYTLGGREGHKQALEAEGVQVDKNYRVDIEKLLWEPKAPDFC